MNFRDAELLSAYLDGQLDPPDVARLEARLASDAQLKVTLEDLRQTRGLLRRLPQRRAPRNFRLTAKMAGVKPPEPRAYPIFRFASALAAFLFLASVALNAFTPFAASHLAAAPQAAYGMGGGGSGGGGPSPEEFQTSEAAQQTEQSQALAPGAPAATEAPLQAPAPFAQLAPTATAEATMSSEAATAVAAAPPAQDTARASAAATELANKAAPAQPVANMPSAPSQPVPVFWMIALGVLMLAFGGAAWWLRANNERRIRSQWNQK